MSETNTGAIDRMSPAETAAMNAMRDGESVTDAPDIEIDTGTPEPAARETAAPDIDLDLDDAPEPGAENRSKTVPHAQFHAANERRKAAVAAAQKAEQALATERAVTQERLRLLIEAVQQPVAQAKPEPVEIPDISTDPVGHLQAIIAQQAAKQAETDAMLRGFTEQQTQAQQIADLRNWGIQQETAFTATQPDFYKAMDFLREGRHAELEAAGVADPAARHQIIAQDITQIAIAARQQNANYAERLWNVAQKRGYKAAEVIPPLDADTPIPDRAARAQAGRDNATTLANVGSAAPLRLTPEKISNMSEKEFDGVLAKLKGNPAGLRALMGE